MIVAAGIGCSFAGLNALDGLHQLNERQWYIGFRAAGFALYLLVTIRVLRFMVIRAAVSIGRSPRLPRLCRGFDRNGVKRQKKMARRTDPRDAAGRKAGRGIRPCTHKPSGVMRRQCLLCPYSGRSCAAAQNVAMGHKRL